MTIAKLCVVASLALLLNGCVKNGNNNNSSNNSIRDFVQSETVPAVNYNYQTTTGATPVPEPTGYLGGLVFIAAIAKIKFFSKKDKL
jgi:hypothetical protein